MDSRFVKVGFHIMRLTSPFITAALVLMSGANSSGFSGDKTLATVNNEVVTLSDYHFFVRSLGIPERPGMIDEEVLKKMLEEKVILDEAKKRGMEISEAETDRLVEEFRKNGSMSQEDMERELRKEGLDMSGYRKLLKNRLMALRLIETEVDSKVIVTEKEVEDFYKINEKEFLTGPEKAVLKAIFLKLNEDATVTEITDLKRKALRITAQMEQGERFETLVRQYADDRLKSEDGKWGEFEKGTLIPLLDEKVFSMKAGEVSEPLWVRDGVYILKLEGKIGGTIRPLKEVGAEIGRYLRGQKKERLFNEWMKTLWEKASIKVN